jgi:TatD DNase family protein
MRQQMNDLSCGLLYDAHNHLPAAFGAAGSVVCGTGTADWSAVATAARQWSGAGSGSGQETELEREQVELGQERVVLGQGQVVPAFGVHPWRLAEQAGDWLGQLRELLREFPDAPLGEVGIDAARAGGAARGGGGVGGGVRMEVQTEALRAQLALARDEGRPAVLHCVRAFGTAEALLREAALPRGFLLHGYGGPAEMVPSFAALGGWFSFSARMLGTDGTGTAGATAEKGAACSRFWAARRRALLAVPADRLLLETDASPDCPPTEALAALREAYRFAASLLGEDAEIFAARIAGNFQRFYCAVSSLT